MQVLTSTHVKKRFVLLNIQHRATRQCFHVVMFHYHFPYIFKMVTLCFFFSVQVFYPKENFNNPLILDLIFQQVDYIICFQLFLLLFNCHQK